jgi:selenocysteine-specific elongation factor
VLRTSSPSETVAGGRILDPSPPTRRRNPVETVEMLENLMLGAENESLAIMISASLLTGVTFTELSKRTGLAAKKLGTLLAPMLSSGEIIQVVREPAIYLSRDAFAATCAVIMNELNSYIIANPLKDGIGREELKTRMPARSDQRFFSSCLKYLENSGSLTAEKDLVKISGGRNCATPDAERIMLDIETQLKKSGLEPFPVKQLAELLKLPVKSVQDHLNLLIRGNRTVKVNSDLYYAIEPFRSIENMLIAHLKEKREITPGEFRELTGLSRKFTIPLLNILIHKS